jgi:hypothetical protein
MPNMNLSYKYFFKAGQQADNNVGLYLRIAVYFSFKSKLYDYELSALS